MARYITPRDDPKAMVFVEEQPSDVKCGVCHETMVFQVYYKDKQTYDFLVCKKCNTFLQRVVEEE